MLLETELLRSGGVCREWRARQQLWGAARGALPLRPDSHLTQQHGGCAHPAPAPGLSTPPYPALQLSALLLRPHHDSRWRRPWNLFHHWVGRAAVLVAVANVYE